QVCLRPLTTYALPSHLLGIPLGIVIDHINIQPVDFPLIAYYILEFTRWQVEAVESAAISGHSLYYVRSLWSSPVLCPQSLVISCTMSAVSGHLPVLCPQSLVIPVLCPQSLVIPCTVSAVSGHPLYWVSLWSSPVLCLQSLVIPCTMCPQSLVISCTVSAVSGHLLYSVRSPWSSPDYVRSLVPVVSQSLKFPVGVSLWS
ncbi:unnamed protein product, partial [Staurois parvus]